MARPSGESVGQTGAPEGVGQTLAPSSLVRALRHLLRPLVRLLLSNHITYPLLSNLLKSVYVEIAEREFALEGKRLSDSRLSLLTGIHRKDTKRLRAEGSEEYLPPPSVSLGARLAARWTSEPEFLDASGAPRALACVADATGTPTFERLVASVSKDIRPRAVLDEWVRLGVVEVEREAGERVRLRVEAFVPEKGFDEKAHYFGRNTHDHLAAGVHNLMGQGPPMLERSVYYDGLRPESVDELAHLSERLAMDALKKVNSRAMSLQTSDAGSVGARMRMNFGSYFFAVRTDDSPGDSREQERGDE
jgi:hypothetical protein